MGQNVRVVLNAGKELREGKKKASKRSIFGKEIKGRK